MATDPEYTATITTELAQTLPVQKQKLQHWKPRIKAWQESGLSQTGFCKNQHLNLQQFTYWKNKILGKAGVDHDSCTKNKPGHSAFVPVQSGSIGSDASLRMRLPNGIVLSGITEHNVVLLKTILQAL